MWVDGSTFETHFERTAICNDSLDIRGEKRPNTGHCQAGDVGACVSVCLCMCNDVSMCV